MAILTSSGRAAVAAAIKAQPLHLAWGAGDPAWDTSPIPPAIYDSMLVSEIGRRAITQSLFCYPDPGGEIVVPEGRFTVSEQPTNSVYMRFNFDFTDAPASDIREFGVFLGTVVSPDVPAGQKYFTLADLVLPGQMLAVERVKKFSRSAAVRQSFEFVITF